MRAPPGHVSLGIIFFCRVLHFPQRRARHSTTLCCHYSRHTTTTTTLPRPHPPTLSSYCRIVADTIGCVVEGVEQNSLLPLLSSQPPGASGCGKLCNNICSPSRRDGGPMACSKPDGGAAGRARGRKGGAAVSDGRCPEMGGPRGRGLLARLGPLMAVAALACAATDAAAAATQRRRKTALIEGDILIGALFSVHESPKQKTASTLTCGKVGTHLYRLSNMAGTHLSNCVLGWVQCCTIKDRPEGRGAKPTTEAAR